MCLSSKGSWSDDMYLEELECGKEYVTPPARIEKEKMVAFSLEYDPFPLH